MSDPANANKSAPTLQDDLLAVVRELKADWLSRIEGCPDLSCLVCRQRRAFEAKVAAVLARATKETPDGK